MFYFKDVIELFAEILFAIKTMLNSSRLLHARMIKSIINSRLRFLHATPTGRILNRFTRDINLVEAQLPYSFNRFVHSVLALANSFVLISYQTPIVLAGLVPMGVLFLFILVSYYYINNWAS